MKIVKLDDKPRHFTLEDVKPGERFRFGEYWSVRLKEENGCVGVEKDKVGIEGFWSFIEASKRLVFLYRTDQEVEIEGRSPPERKKVKVGDCKPGDLLEFEGGVMRTIHYVEPHIETIRRKVHYNIGPSDWGDVEAYKLEVVEMHVRDAA